MPASFIRRGGGVSLPRSASSLRRAGVRPMNIARRLERSIPVKLLKKTKKLVVG